MDAKQKEFLKKGFCTPAVIGLVIAVLSVLGAKKGQHLTSIIGGAVQVGILFTLCYYGYDKAAWVFLLLPLILLVPVIAFVLGYEYGSGGMLPTFPVKKVVVK